MKVTLTADDKGRKGIKKQLREAYNERVSSTHRTPRLTGNALNEICLECGNSWGSHRVGVGCIGFFEWKVLSFWQWFLEVK